MRPVRFGIVSTALIARQWVIPAMRAAPECEVVAICSRDPDRAAAVARDAGIPRSYGSLEAIMEITPDFIKTDMGLVRGIDSDPPRQEVVRALASVARGIGAQVIAEGIETDAELRALRELGVRYGQGYVFGAAIPGQPPSATGEIEPGDLGGAAEDGEDDGR